MKEFNVAGNCIPNEHYMVDTTEKLDKIIKLIDKKRYFTMNRSRQFGKTTTLRLLEKRLKENNIVISISFEGVGDSAFENEEKFSKMFFDNVDMIMEYTFEDKEIQSLWNQNRESVTSLDELSKHISRFCRDCKKEVVLFIDEVDKSSENQMFLSFIGMLCNKYLVRDKGIPTFKSVILAGVCDIKNLKLKIRPDEEKKYNSPWNIAVDFNVDMSFSAAEITTMLSDYEKDYNTGMDKNVVAEEIYRYTSGHPFLVSRICLELFHHGKEYGTEHDGWTSDGVASAVRDILKEVNTLFDDLVKNYENNKELGSVIKQVINGAEVSFNPLQPEISLGVMFGIFKNKNDKVAVANLVFETLLYNYIISDMEVRGLYAKGPSGSRYISNGRLNIELVFERFCKLMYSEYSDREKEFLEREGRLLFLFFLKPIINGKGHYYVEPQTRDETKMDVVVAYGEDEFIIELKIWRGKKYNTDGRYQLADYLKARDAAKGYLVSFCFNETNKEEIIRKYSGVCSNLDGKEIYEVIV